MHCNRIYLYIFICSSFHSISNASIWLSFHRPIAFISIGFSSVEFLFDSRYIWLWFGPHRARKCNVAGGYNQTCLCRIHLCGCAVRLEWFTIVTLKFMYMRMENENSSTAAYSKYDSCHKVFCHQMELIVNIQTSPTQTVSVCNWTHIKTQVAKVSLHFPKSIALLNFPKFGRNLKVHSSRFSLSLSLSDRIRQRKNFSAFIAIKIHNCLNNIASNSVVNTMWDVD